MRLAAVAPQEMVGELARRLAGEWQLVPALGEPAGEAAAAQAPATARLAAALRACERRLRDERPDAVLVAGEGSSELADIALAAALVAVKLGIPVAVVGSASGLLGLLGDLVLGDGEEAATRLASWRPRASGAAGSGRS